MCGFVLAPRNGPMLLYGTVGAPRDGLKLPPVATSPPISKRVRIINRTITTPDYHVYERIGALPSRKHSRCSRKSVEQVDVYSKRKRRPFRPDPVHPEQVSKRTGCNSRSPEKLVWRSTDPNAPSFMGADSVHFPEGPSAGPIVSKCSNSVDPIAGVHTVCDPTAVGPHLLQESPNEYPFAAGLRRRLGGRILPLFTLTV